MPTVGKSMTDRRKSTRLRGKCTINVSNTSFCTFDISLPRNVGATGSEDRSVRTTTCPNSREEPPSLDSIWQPCLLGRSSRCDRGGARIAAETKTVLRSWQRYGSTFYSISDFRRSI